MLSILSILSVFIGSLLSIAYAFPIHITLASEEKKSNVLNSITLYFFLIVMSVLILMCCLSIVVLIFTKFMKNK